MTDTPHTEELYDSDELYEHYRIEADPGQELLRLDKFLVNRMPNTSRNRIQNAIKCEAVKVNGQPVKANYKIRPGDIATLSLPHPPREDVVVPENIPLDIVYEDDELLIVNKPAGMVVHPGYNNWAGTLVNALAYYFDNLPQGKNGAMRPGLVHRIDKDTTGLMVIAKTEWAMTHLAKQFFDHTIERSYYALVWGDPEEDKGTVSGYIGRSANDRRVMHVYTDEDKGKWSVTHYEVLERYHYVSLIRCTLETGRTHQIRAHMRYIGHPLFNDSWYGGAEIVKGTGTAAKYKQFVENTFAVLPRQALHAKSLGFIHPTSNKPLFFDSALPDDFTEALKRWEKYTGSFSWD